MAPEKGGETQKRWRGGQKRLPEMKEKRHENWKTKNPEGNSSIILIEKKKNPNHK